MLATLRRLRVLAAWLVVCAVAGPVASAMCAERSPAEVLPCHESGDDGAMEHGTTPEPASHHSSETACLSACCVAADVPAEAVVVAPGPALAPVVREVIVEASVVATSVPAVAARAHPPPGPGRLEIGRLLI